METMNCSCSARPRVRFVAAYLFLQGLWFKSCYIRARNVKVPGR